MFFAKKIDKCTYQVREKDPETGKEAFQLRLWDARIGRWLTTDPKGQSDIKPLTGGGGKTINGVTYKWEIKLTGQKWSTWCLWE
ncbi:hypothetical protein TPENAI_60785 [Tenacibaculum litopenaei]|uniref:hypothetical protein n=1 Tax=Tenacibaculum litopenaei TaxID=396016 RepID=UPI00389543FA